MVFNVFDEGKIYGFVFSLGFIIGVIVYVVVIFIVVVIGNFLVIYIVSVWEYMRNLINILIVNMVVVDILMVCIFFYFLKWFYVMSLWFGIFMGIVLCKFFYFV